MVRNLWLGVSASQFLPMNRKHEEGPNCFLQTLALTICGCACPDNVPACFSGNGGHWGSQSVAVGVPGFPTILLKENGINNLHEHSWKQTLIEMMPISDLLVTMSSLLASHYWPISPISDLLLTN